MSRRKQRKVQRKKDPGKAIQRYEKRRKESMFDIERLKRDGLWGSA